MHPLETFSTETDEGHQSNNGHNLNNTTTLKNSNYQRHHHHHRDNHLHLKSKWQKWEAGCLQKIKCLLPDWNTSHQKHEVLILSSKLIKSVKGFHKLKLKFLINVSSKRGFIFLQKVHKLRLTQNKFTEIKLTTQKAFCVHQILSDINNIIT